MEPAPESAGDGYVWFGTRRDAQPAMEPAPESAGDPWVSGKPTATRIGPQWSRRPKAPVTWTVGQDHAHYATPAMEPAPESAGDPGATSDDPGGPGARNGAGARKRR